MSWMQITISKHWFLLAIGLVIAMMLSGCKHLRKGEYVNIENRVLGVDASMPIPFADGVNFLNAKVGWVETTYSHGYGTHKEVKTSHSILYLGTAERYIHLGVTQDKK